MGSKIRPGKDNVPLSEGLFNREVYLEGLKRRSEALHPPLAGEMTCDIQWSCFKLRIHTINVVELFQLDNYTYLFII